MELTIGGLASREEFERAGIGLPAFDVARMQRDGKLDPRWVHIGPGNIFRIFIARLAQEMTAAGHRWPVTAVVPLDPVELDVQLARHDLMTLGVTLNPDGTRGLEVIAGVCEGLATRRVGAHVVAFPAQRTGEGLGDGRIVFNEENCSHANILAIPNQNFHVS